MVERIREILQVNQLTPTQFADSIGVARPIISHILSGRNKPSLEVVQKIVTAFPQLSLDWLLKGAGSMLAGTLTAAPITASITASNQSIEPIASPAKEPASSAMAQRTTTMSRYRPQPVPVVAGSHQSSESAPEAPLAPPPHYVAPDAPSATSAALPAAVSAKQSATVPAPVVSGAEPVVAVPSVPIVPAEIPAEAVASQAAVAAPARVADVSLATAFAEPGKTIRRIVIFYQDGTFTDYQPEPRTS